MGLLAYRSNGTPVVSVYLDDEEWAAECLNANRDLLMPETGKQAVPKVSRLGNRFFSHKPGESPEGGTAPESDDHIALKILALKAARAAGWDALPEIGGQAPSGKSFRADVMCSRPGGSGRVAIEIQRSNQRDVDYASRQSVYEESGIRGIWIDVSKKDFKQHILKQTRSVPRFECKRTDPDLPGEYVVLVKGQQIEFGEFIRGALTGRLRFVDFEYRSKPQSVWLYRSYCWRCDEELYMVDPEYVDDIARESPALLAAMNTRLTSDGMCEVKLIRLNGGRTSEYRSCCPKCGIGQSQLNSGNQLTEPYLIGSMTVTRASRGMFSRYWGWDIRPRPELIPEPGRVFICTGEDDDDKQELEAIRASVKDCNW